MNFVKMNNNLKSQIQTFSVKEEENREDNTFLAIGQLDNWTYTEIRTRYCLWFYLKSKSFVWNWGSMIALMQLFSINEKHWTEYKRQCPGGLAQVAAPPTGWRSYQKSFGLYQLYLGRLLVFLFSILGLGRTFDPCKSLPETEMF